jgi:hypothetical protein
MQPCARLDTLQPRDANFGEMADGHPYMSGNWCWQTVKLVRCYGPLQRVRSRRRQRDSSALTVVRVDRHNGASRRRARVPQGRSGRRAPEAQREGDPRLDWARRLPAYKLRKEWRIRRDDFDQAMQARRTTAEPAPAGGLWDPDDHG